MAREIADSDDEIDLVSKAQAEENNQLANLATPVPVEDADQSDPLHSTVFDDFLSPTQRLSSMYDGHQNNEDLVTTSNILDSSTNRFFNELATTSEEVSSPPKPGSNDSSQPIDSSMGGKRKRAESRQKTSSSKRARTLMEYDSSNVESEFNLRKRSKTANGSSADRTTNPESVHSFVEAMQSSAELPVDQHIHIEAEDSHNLVNPVDLVSVDARTNYTSPLDLSLNLSPSNGAGPHNAASDVSRLSRNELSDVKSHNSRGQFLGMTLPGITTSRSSIGNYQSFSINPGDLGMAFDKINPFGSLSQISLPGDTDSEETRGIAEIFRANAGYNSKNSKVHPVNPGDELNNDVHSEAAKLSKSPRTRRNPQQSSPPFSPITNPDDQNAGEIPSLSPVEHANNETAPKKRGRKLKNKQPDLPTSIDIEDGGQVRSDDPSTDRVTRAGTVDSISNLSEISHGTTNSRSNRKSRSKKTEMLPPELQSKKLPSSDLGLNDKAVIGLSPERYVPRPSRRRAEEDANVGPDEAANNSSQTHDASKDSKKTAEVASPVKGKRGRKSKVKRAKTSAAALLKQQNDFLDDEEREEAKEVIFMDERPAKVKLQPLVEVSPDRKLKMEASLQDDETKEDEAEDEIITTRRSKVTVDVPVLSKPDEHSELPAPVPEPKKRGRKRKKPLQESQPNPTEQEDQSTVLADKDTNIQMKKHHSSKIDDPSDQDQENTNLDENNISLEKEQTPQTDSISTSTSTPTKPLPTTANPKHAQTHSPLKPMSSSSLFITRARIGLSKRHSIPSLLRKVDRNKEAPKVIERKEKLNKRQLEEKEQERIAREEAEAEGREYVPLDVLRGKDGLLVEWDF